MPTTNHDPIDAHYLAHWDHFSSAEIVGHVPAPYRGRHEHAAFIARVIDGALFRRLDRIRAAVAEFKGVVPVPDHCLHVPIAHVGAIAPRKAGDGEIAESKLQEISEQARTLLANARAMTVRIARVNVGNDEIFAELHPVEGLLELRSVLRPATGGIDADTPYLPRLPLARIIAPVRAQPLRQALEWFRDRPIGTLVITTVALVRYDARANNPALSRIAELHLPS